MDYCYQRLTRWKQRPVREAQTRVLQLAVSLIKKNHMTSWNSNILAGSFKCYYGQFSLILKVNPCLFSSFPYQQYPVSPTDGSPEHSFKLVSVKGHLRIPAGCHIASVMKCCCPCSLGSTGEGFWQSLSHSAEDSSLSCMPCPSKWKSTLFTTIISRFHPRCSDSSHSDLFQMMGLEMPFAKGKISHYVLFSQPKMISKGDCF